jgi:hypothetical protein
MEAAELKRLAKLKAEIEKEIEAEAEKEGAAIYKHRAFTSVRKGKNSGKHSYGAGKRDRAF